MNTLELKVLVSEAIEEIIAKSYRQGKFDVEINRVGKLAPEIGDKLKQVKRDRIVEQAKADIESLKGRCRGVRYRSIDDLYHISDGSYSGSYALRAKFVINKHKRTVVVLMYGAFSNKVRSRGIAKCASSDCFNVHIGKAIALRRALGLKVPVEYLNAPQPTEVRVGDIVKYPNGRIVEILEKSFYDVNRVKEVSTGEISSATTFELTKIIDDSREGVTQ